MTSRKIFLMGIAFLFGVITAAVRPGILMIVGASALIVLLFVWIMRQKERMTVVVLLAFLMLAFGMGDYRYQQVESQRSEVLSVLCDGMSVTLQGELYKKEEKNNQNYLYLKKCYLNLDDRIYETRNVLVYLKTNQSSIGKTLIINGTLKTWTSATNEGNFDQQTYYESLGIDYALEADTVQEVAKPLTICDRYENMLQNLRAQVNTVYLTDLSDDNAGTMCAMVLGEKSDMEQAQKERYRLAGVLHLCSISGMHVALLGMCCFRILRKIGFPFLVASPVAYVVTLSFYLMTGCGISTFRAMVMFAFLVTAQVLGRAYDSSTALSVSMILLMWENPLVLWNGGFQLSFAAVLGIVWIYPVLGGDGTKALDRRRAEKKKKEKEAAIEKGKEKAWKKTVYHAGEKVGVMLYETCKVTFAIQLALVPLLARQYYEIPIYTLLFNILLLPLAGLLIGSGILGGLVGTVWAWAGSVILAVTDQLLSYYDRVCALAQRNGHAMWIVGCPENWKLILYYLFLVGVYLLTRQWKKHGRFCRNSVFVLALVLFCLNPSLKRKEFIVSVLDVGQGDGTCIETTEGDTFFIDGGSSSVRKVGTYRILPFLKVNKIRHIDGWFLTHMDSDHINGVEEILEAGYPVGTLILARTVVRNDNYEKLLEIAGKADCPITYMEAGTVLRGEEYKISCLFPDEDFASEDANERSLVLEVESGGYKGIFTGDITEKSETYLLQQMQELGLKTEEITMLKAAHHGSKYSNSSDFLERLQPKITTISAGEDNRYGHPHAEALERIRESGSRIFDTIESGEIRIVWRDTQLLVEKYRENLRPNVVP